MMNEEKKKQITSTLFKRVGHFVCPICHQSKFAFLEGYFLEVVQDDYKFMKLDGRMLPSVVLVCNNCGHIDKFSLGVLGLMEQPDDEKKNESSRAE